MTLNLVLTRVNLLKPVFKMGDNFNPENYRGIAISSNVYKLYCQVMNERLSNFLCKKNIIAATQIGFMKKSTISNHILALGTLIDKYVKLTTGSKLFVFFVHFKSSFDTVWRHALFHKLRNVGFLHFLQKMLENIYCDVQL